MPLQPGFLLHGRYRIMEELGRGGMGAVYRGYDENLGIDVAVKENLVVSAEFERQFKREAILLASLRHPHLPRVTDHFVILGQGQYLVMDYIAGDDARQRLAAQGGPLPEAEVLRWARQILEALVYLHSRQPPVVHRDIKPGNIKITPDNRAVLVDFGLAKIHDAQQSTTVGAQAFTRGYAPPEQYGLGHTDSRSDIYSLAASLYVLLTARMPTDALERALMGDDMPTVRALNPTIAPHVSAAIERGLALKPEDRFASAADFAAALASAPPAEAPTELQSLPLAVPATPTTPPRHLSPLVLTALIPILAATLLAVAAGGLVIWRLWVSVRQPTATAAAVASSSLTPAVAPPSQPTATQRPALAIFASPTTTPQATITSLPVSPTAPPPSLTPTASTTPLGGGAGQIAFVSERVGRPQIFLMNVDGSSLIQLTYTADGACQPAWSPDGQKLLFISACPGKRDAYPKAIVYKLDLRTANSAPQPFLAPAGGGIFDIAWSNTGIAFTYIEDGREHIYTTEDGWENRRLLSARNAEDSQPSWSPDGQKIAFRNTTRAGRPALYWMNSDGTFNGSNPNPVTREVNASAPAWSPDGDHIAYVNDSSQQIWLVKWDALGFNAAELTVRGPNADPAWSPDGQWLVFESWRDAANHDIYIMTASGGNVTRLTDDPALDYQPAWRP